MYPIFVREHDIEEQKLRSFFCHGFPKSLRMIETLALKTAVVQRFEDAKPLTHGMWGFFSTGKELSVLECTVAPLE